MSRMARNLRITAAMALALVSACANAQTLGDLADKTAEAVALRQQLAHAQAAATKPAQAAKTTGAPAQQPQFVSRPVYIQAPTTPPPPAPPAGSGQ